MGYPGSCPPGKIRDLSTFMEGLRDLKRCSGLSYRQLEERAAAVGDVLPRSSVSSMLSRDMPPRLDLLMAFVKACGEGDRAAEWAGAWERVAGAYGKGPSLERAASSTAHASRWRRVRPAAVAAAAMAVAVLVVAAAVRTSFGGGEGRAGFAAVSGSPAAGAAPPHGWVTIRVADSPDLCLTDGRVPGWRYTPLVAVQRPCEEVSPQGTLLEPLGQGLYRIQWHHPDYGKGCLRALAGGSGKGLLEPMDDCAQGSAFSIEPSRRLGRGTFVLRVQGEGCVGIARPGGAAGTEAVMQRCDGESRQVFLIRAVDGGVGAGRPAVWTEPSTRAAGKYPTKRES
ncbi:hypothetical protein RND61_09835 [Streptomyces sp. TRM76323]|uniref:Ricin B lectin domain-containing protein n=1 Tax=Streptomyces tamarix TaxID=3078565 RepID=A0ABU3QHY1_9ACTN|nr:hypothetical protein [Streptomyces tamarix]MDT9682368.1 hypothetical protein [Streptomyces tamarix]